MEQRLQYLRSILEEKNIDALFIASSINIGYLTNYFGFSLVEREAYMLITKEKQILFTDARYTHEVSKNSKSYSVCELTYDRPLAFHLLEIAKKEKLLSLGFEPNVLTISEYKKINVKNFKLVPISLRNLREKKTTEEITNIKKACEIGDKTFSYIQKEIALGMTELEVAELMEGFIRKQGATLSFATIVAFGKNAAIPHHHTNDQRLKTGDCILLDFGVKHNNYCSDMTRTIFFQTAHTKQKTIYQTVKKAQEKAAEYIQDFLKSHPGVAATTIGSQPKDSIALLQNDYKLNLSDVDKIAREYILSQGYPSIPHGLGHGIGLEVHESPSLSARSEDILSEGMVFSIEPGIYFVENGGVRIEDLFAVQNNKLVKLTQASSSLLVLD